MVVRSKPEVQTRTAFAIAILIVVLILPGASAAQSAAPWFGTWTLNIGRSTANSDRYKRVISRIEPWDDGLKVTYDMVGTRGGITHMEWIGKFDGNDYPVQGVDYVLTNAYRLVNDHSYQIVIQVDGAVVATAGVTISADGKTLTTTTTEKNPQGQNVNTTTVYEKR